jgi:hypothetical protein
MSAAGRAAGLGCMAAALVALLALQACRSTAPVAPAVNSTVPGGPLASEPAVPGLPTEAPLASEARWLSELFAGTPVQVIGEADGSVRIQVPLKFAFDPGTPTTVPSSTPKPPLQAVLDKVSQSLKRRPAAKLQAVSPGPSAAERLAAIRSALLARGVPAWRVAQASSAGDEQVLLRLVQPAGGVKKLDDQNLPPTNAGRITPPGGASGSGPGAHR